MMEGTILRGIHNNQEDTRASRSFCPCPVNPFYQTQYTNLSDMVNQCKYAGDPGRTSSIRSSVPLSTLYPSTILICGERLLPRKDATKTQWRRKSPRARIAVQSWQRRRSRSWPWPWKRWILPCNRTRFHCTDVYDLSTQLLCHYLNCRRSDGENTIPGGYHTPQGQARRGIGSPPANYNSYSAPSPGYSSPRGKRGRGRGSRGRGGGDGPLSKLLYEDRPYLRPIKFVPSVNTRILFQEQEEILKPVAEEVGTCSKYFIP